jgi:hypothetical protein
VEFVAAFLDGRAVDAGDAKAHRPFPVEFPGLGAATAKPLPAIGA